MKDIEKIVKAAMASILALTTASAFAAKEPAGTSMENVEKCYGIAKAAMNDCDTATATCAGSSTQDKQADAYILLPKGICNRIVGGSLTPKTEKKTK